MSEGLKEWQLKYMRVLKRVSRNDEFEIEYKRSTQ